MDLDAEFNRLRRLSARVEPMIVEYEARQAAGTGAPAGFMPEASAELARVQDQLDAIDARLSPWEQGEKDVPPGIQDLAQRIVERIDRIEEKLAAMDKFSGELARLSRMTADLAEIVENKVPVRREDWPNGEAAGATGATGAQVAGSSE